MGFFSPKAPKVATPPPAPRPPNPAMDPLDAEALLNEEGVYTSARSLISTTSRGLKRRASTQRTSLIGG